MYFTCFKQKDMKISKSGLLNLSLVFTVLGLWLVAVSMAQRQLYVDLNNAAQYMEKVKFISTWSNDSAFLEQIGDGSVKIQTNNFILSRTWSDENIISGAYYSSILWWIKNKIEWKRNRDRGTNVIIGWSENLINSEYNVILWWKWNKIENWKYSVIVWWKDNTLSWNYSVILWSNNTLEGSQSTVVWRSGYVKGNYSAALWTNSKVEANNSFLWTDGSTTETLTGDNLFVIMAGSGMIINNNVAHRFAKLTIWWPLIVSSKNTDENIQCGTWKGWWILKIKNAGSQMCLCSCNGSWRNSMLGKGKCMGICDSSIKPECGNDVQRIKVWNFIEYSWSCIFGKVVKWTWAYLVTKYDKVNWSCQTDDGQTIGCSGTATGYPYRSCWGSHPNEWVIVWGSVYVEVNWIKTWHYTSGSTPWVCEYTCDTSKGYHWNGEMCVNTYECIWDQPWENTTGSTVAPTWSNKSWTYKETWALWACEWRCKSSNYERDWLTMNCKPKTYACTWTQPWENTTGSTVAPTWSNKSWTYKETWALWACEWRCKSSNYERDWLTMNCKPKTYACTWTMPWAHTKTWSNVTTQQNQQWEYTESSTPWACEWTCLSWYTRDGLTCKKNGCQWTLPEGVTLNNPDTEPSSPTNYFCNAESTQACSYTCPRGYTCNSAWTGCRLQELWQCDETEKYGCMNSSDTVEKVDTTWDNQRKWYCNGTDWKSVLCTYSCPTGKHLMWTSLHVWTCITDSPWWGWWGCACKDSLPDHASKVTAEEIRDGANYDGELCEIVGRCEWNHATNAVYTCPYHTQEACMEHSKYCTWNDMERDWFICDQGYELVGCECIEPHSWLSCDNICESADAQEYAGICYKTCFTSWTKVTMVDWSQKNIEDIKIWEKVLWSNWKVNTVLWYDRPILWNRHLWSINGSEYFVSDEHPFMTTQWWKSFNPEMTRLEIDLNTTELKVWDVLITENGQEEIKLVDYINADYNTPLYNLMLDWDHTYYANNYLVHNKIVQPEVSTEGVCLKKRVPWLGHVKQKCCPNNYAAYLNWRCVIECGASH